MARLICIGMTLALLLFLPGCGGCRQTPPKDKTAEEVEKEREELRKRELERAKPDFEAKFLVSRPSAGRVAGTAGTSPAIGPACRWRRPRPTISTSSANWNWP